MAECRAIRVAAAFRRRFGTAAGHHAGLRLDIFASAGNDRAVDLYVAVGAVLRDHDAVFSRSRA